jgi:glycosyltransferase involved in cell wall biosynthesis
VEDVCGWTGAALAEKLAAGVSAIWFVRAGAWPAGQGTLTFPPANAASHHLCALGAVRPGPEGHADAGAAKPWELLQHETGGDYALAANLGTRLPNLVSAYLEAEPLRDLVERLGRGEDLAAALRAIVCGSGARVVRFTPLDVYFDPCLRVVQLVTSLQQGGAERIVLSLVRGLGRHGVRWLLVTLSPPGRACFPAPAGTVDLTGKPGGRSARLRAATDVIATFASDLVHGHLLDGSDVRQLAAGEVPLVLTIHNTRPGWPAGLETLRPGDAALLVGCARAVEADLRSTPLSIPVRTVWNGIDFTPFERTPALLAAAQAWRQRLGLGTEDFVLLALANPRPQKRLERLPAVLAATQAELARRGSRRKARLLIAGALSQTRATAAASEEALRQEIRRLELEADVHLLGSVDPIAALLAASNVLVSTSAHEGLSLAHLEALAVGLPVAATDAGGTAELAHENPAVTVLPLDAEAEPFAQVLAGIAESPPPEGRSRTMVDFSQERMVARYRYLYPRAIEAGRGQRRGEGLLLVINNFSTGGAQSSARRLLLGLAAEGVRVRAAVLQEQPAYPTPGRRALTDAAIPVLALPPAGTVDPVESVAMLLEWIDDDLPAVVLLWNALTQHKVLLADGLLDIPLFDISPGEMYFTSLERYLARPRPGLPYRSGRDYGARLAGAIVKYHAEAEQAARVLGAPVHVIPNGVPLGRTPPERRTPGDVLVIGTAARLSPQKKLEDLLAALRRASPRLPRYVLRIAGGADGNDTAYVEDLKEQARGMCVDWVGELDDSWSFLHELDFFAMISEPAGCPNASLEAMAAGLAVVATDVGGTSEQVDDGVTGRLVPRGDLEALAEGLIELGRDAGLRARWGAAGRKRAEERFDLRRMVADYRRVCLDQLSFSFGGSPVR